MTRPTHSPQRDRAWARFYAQRGLRPIVPAGDRERAAPISNEQRIEAWRRKYATVPVEMQCQPIRRQS
jgi:hypothetical protein